MLLTQTTALFVDAYRELNARRLFWISLAISMLVVLVFAAVGINQTGFVIFWKQFPNDTINTRFIDRGMAYKALFESLGINWWLTWAATGLALVSTASLFPDFLTGGTIDLYLSKPIGRVRLFVTKYLTGLLFVTLQVVTFCVASFLVIGVRGGVWEPAIFVAVPLVVLFFSYLYAALIFFGMVTRSTIASLLLTILFWAATVAVHYTEHALLQFSVMRQLEQQRADEQIEQDQKLIDHLVNGGAVAPDATMTPATSDRAMANPATSVPTTDASSKTITFADRQLQMTRASLAVTERERADITDSFASWHRAVALIDWPLPKTTQTYDLTKRVLGERLRLRPPRQPIDDDQNGPRGNPFRNMQLMRQAETNTEKIEQSQGLTYVVGTSLLFECVILGLTAWIFQRRDF